MNFLREPAIFPLKMISIYVIIRFAYLYYGDTQINFGNEVLEILSVSFFIIIIYVIASTVPLSSQKSSPLSVQESILERIMEDIQYVTLDNHRGVYNLPSISFEDGSIKNTYEVFNFPEQVIIKSSAYIRVLQTVNTGAADRYINRLEMLKEEARYMMLNPVDRIVIK